MNISDRLVEIRDIIQYNEPKLGISPFFFLLLLTILR